jgi:hypothetical protein
MSDEMLLAEVSQAFGDGVAIAAHIAKEKGEAFVVLWRYYCDALTRPVEDPLRHQTAALARHLAAGNSDVPAVYNRKCD